MSYEINSQLHLNFGRCELNCRHKKSHFADTDRKREETLKSTHDSYLAGPEDQPNDAVFQEDDSPSHAAERPTVIEQDDAGSAESDPSFLIESSGNTMCEVKQKDRQIASQVFYLQTDRSF